MLLNASRVIPRGGWCVSGVTAECRRRTPIIETMAWENWAWTHDQGPVKTLHRKPKFGGVLNRDVFPLYSGPVKREPQKKGKRDPDRRPMVPAE
jgi:hypothetical protein